MDEDIREVLKEILSKLNKIEEHLSAPAAAQASNDEKPVVTYSSWRFEPVVKQPVQMAKFAMIPVELAIRDEHE